MGALKADHRCLRISGIDKGCYHTIGAAARLRQNRPDSIGRLCARSGRATQDADQSCVPLIQFEHVVDDAASYFAVLNAASAERLNLPFVCIDIID